MSYSSEVGEKKSLLFRVRERQSSVVGMSFLESGDNSLSVFGLSFGLSFNTICDSFDDSIVLTDLNPNLKLIGSFETNGTITLNSIKLNNNYEAIQKLYKQFKIYIENGDRLIINIPFPEINKRIEGVLSINKNEEVAIRLKYEKFN